MEIKKIIEMLHPLERKIVPHLCNGATAKELESKSALSEIEVVRTLQWLGNKGVIIVEAKEIMLIFLDENGKQYAQKGLPEKRLLAALESATLEKEPKKISLQELGKTIGLNGQEVGISIGLLKQKNAMLLEGMLATITTEGKSILKGTWVEERVLQKLANTAILPDLSGEEQQTLQALQRRKQIVRTEKKRLLSVQLTPIGKELVKEVVARGVGWGGESNEVVDRVTADLLKTGKWKGKEYRRYDVEARVPAISGGRRHFVKQAVEYIKQIWLEFGFREMEGNMVQTAFWDLDCLFVPQDHPARQMQDTFYLKDNKKKDHILRGKFPAALAKRIKAVHEHGGDTGSTGWGGFWSADEASKVLLRTHTTVLSAQAIAQLKKSDLPAKFFSVDTVYRNEALDWKHLFEFAQVEGIVVDPNANLSHLKGYLQEFYRKMGYSDVRMRPAHFPYTEPSVEIEVFNPVKKEWIELGGAGIFRPEMVQSLLGIDVPVLAWGLGMGRIISEHWDITDIRDLNKNDLKQLRETKVFLRD